jgi:hypothetical protein
MRTGKTVVISHRNERENLKSPSRLEDIVIINTDLQMKGCKNVDRFKLTLDSGSMANCVEMELAENLGELAIRFLCLRPLAAKKSLLYHQCFYK